MPTTTHRGVARRIRVPIPNGPLPLYPIGPSARFYKVHPNTMRKWCKWGLIPHRITPSGQIEVDIVRHLQMAGQQQADEPTAAP